MMDKDGYSFACSGCGEEFLVDSALRTALMEHGCVVCGMLVSLRDFESHPNRSP